MDSDPRGGSEVGIVHRGKGFGGESGGLGMRVRGQRAWFRIREEGQSWGLFTKGTGSKVRVGAGHACERARSSVSDLRGGSELGINYRGKGFGGESGGLACV